MVKLHSCFFKSYQAYALHCHQISLGEASLKKREHLGKIPYGGELKKQTKIPNFNLGILRTQGGGLDFSKMSEL